MPDKKFTVMVIKVFTGLEKKVKDLRDNFHKEKTKRNKSELKNVITEMKHY